MSYQTGMFTPSASRSIVAPTADASIVTGFEELRWAPSGAPAAFGAAGGSEVDVRGAHPATANVPATAATTDKRTAMRRACCMRFGATNDGLQPVGTLDLSIARNRVINGTYCSEFGR